MCNCYSVCGEGFEGTINMVAQARGRTPEDVKETLSKMASAYAGEDDYRSLRKRLPADFPF